MTYTSRIARIVTILFCAIVATQQTAFAQLKLNQGDHIAIIGNTLADRMQHHGHLETLIVAAHSKHDLVFRNLAVAGDEVVTRHRSENFGSPDEWLTKVKADVIFAFFGFNESFKGRDGLEKFKKDLDKWIKETATKDYSGKGAPRIVLFSPIAAERHLDRNYPDPAPINANLALYVPAMAEVAKNNGVTFVDLFTASGLLFNTTHRPRSLTINGIHLSSEGERELAPAMYQGIFAAAAPAGGDLEKLRAAILEKNRQWHHRYRTVDGYNVYGGRSALAYQPDKGGHISNRNPPLPHISNYQVMQQEMAQRDQLTANRDKRVWAVAAGGDLKVDDSNLPPVTPVKTNKPGSNPDKSHVYLGGEEAISKMKLHPGTKVNLFASEEEWPLLNNPVQMAWDTKGRLWVAAWHSYPERTPTQTKGDSLIIFEDTNGDGKADKCTPFIEDLNCPTGFQFYKDGVLLMQAPDLWFIRDTDGDGKADWKERVVMGLDSADSHHTTNAMCYDPGGAVYLSDGVFHRTQLETAAGPVRNNDAAIYRFEPNTGKLDTYIAYGFANPHGRVFDNWGNDIVTDATGNNSYFGAAISGRIDYPGKHKGVKEFWKRPSRPCPGTWILTSRHFPEDWQGNFFNINVISFQGIYRVKMSQEGSGIQGDSLNDLISSSDPNFRPICMSTGPDGAIYVCDWHQTIIGHMQHHIRDPNRGKLHGRIYRITYEGRPLLKQPKIDGQPIPALLDLLKEPENHVRELAKIELHKHDSAKVIAALKQWVAGLDKSDKEYEHHMMEALWVHQWHNVVDDELLGRMLKSPEPRARAAATRVLCYWRDAIPSALSTFKAMAADDDARVRLHAVRAASFFTSADTLDVVVAAKAKPTDYYLDYVIGETTRQVEPYVRKALASGGNISKDSLKYLISSASTTELLKMKKTENVLQAILSRPDTPDAARNEALNALAEMKKTTRAVAVLTLLDVTAKTDTNALSTMVRLLPAQPPADLKAVRDRLSGLAVGGATSEVRAPAMAALITADQSFDVFKDYGGQPETMSDALAGVSMVVDPDLRAKAYDTVKDRLTRPNGDGQVRRAAIRAAVSINKEQATTFAALVDLIKRGEEVAAAVKGIRIVPRKNWPAKQAGDAAQAIVAWAKTVPQNQRTSQEFIETIQVANDLAGFVDADKQAEVRRDLKSLRVAVFVINTVREQMRYDTPRIVVEAGKPFQMIFENSDFMPHNIVFVNPGTRQEIGEKTAEMRPDETDRQGRAYVPNSRDVIAASKLLENGQKVTLKITAPTKEGEYEYVCTYPGHWESMYGKMIVTKDVDAYLQAHPDSGGAAPAAGHEHKH